MAGRLCGAWEATFCRGKGVMGGHLTGTLEVVGGGAAWITYLPDNPGWGWAGRRSRRGWRWARLGPGVQPVCRWPLLGTCRRSPCWGLGRKSRPEILGSGSMSPVLRMLDQVRASHSHHRKVSEVNKGGRGPLKLKE